MYDSVQSWVNRAFCRETPCGFALIDSDFAVRDEFGLLFDGVEFLCLVVFCRLLSMGWIWGYCVSGSVVVLPGTC